MAFLDNSGDIILDAVLTDTGRKRLAQGDGSFKIVKFAFGDDEIDYTSFDGLHPSGSAYYDLEILQTPVFEAFTNNTSMMKSKLMSLTNNNLLYLPILKLNTIANQFKPVPQNAAGENLFLHSGSHVLVVDQDTNTKLSLLGEGGEAGVLEPGFINGYGSLGPNNIGNLIRVDQGLDTTEVPATLTIDPELKETSYIIEIDSRFASIRDPQSNGAPIAQASFVDDDLIATYYISQATGLYITDSTPDQADGTAPDTNESINGPRGTNLRFGLRAATDIVSSDYLFDTLGTDIADTNGNNYAFIDTTIKVTGVTTGYRLDIPLRIVKLQD